MKKKKFLLIFPAETNDSGMARKKTNNFLDSLPEIRLIADYDLDFIFFGCEKDSWNKLSSLINENFRTYDAFIVYQDYRKLLLAANLVSFVFQNISKPIVFTGSKKQTLAAGATDAKSNLINSFQVAASGINEVCLVFGNRVLRPTRAFVNPSSELNVFDSFSRGLIGKIDFGFSPVKINRRNTQRENAVVFAPVIDDQINCVTLYPFGSLEFLKTGDSHAIVINGGEINEVAAKFIHELKQKVILFKTEGHDCPNCLHVKEGTLESVLAKVMWCLGQTTDMVVFNQLFRLNLAGEWGA